MQGPLNSLINSNNLLVGLLGFSVSGIASMADVCCVSSFQIFITLKTLLYLLKPSVIMLSKCDDSEYFVLFSISRKFSTITFNMMFNIVLFACLVVCSFWRGGGSDTYYQTKKKFFFLLRY